MSIYSFLCVNVAGLPDIFYSVPSELYHIRQTWALTSQYRSLTWGR